MLYHLQFSYKITKIMNLAAILDLKIFTNTINKYKNYQYYSFKTFFYSLYLNNVKNFHCRPF